MNNILTMIKLERCFKEANKIGAKFVAVKIEMDDFDEHEIIVNPLANINKKLKYYKNAYDNNLKHMYAEGIRIVGFTYGDSMEEFEADLF